MYPMPTWNLGHRCAIHYEPQALSCRMGIPVDRDRSFRPIVTDDSGLS